MFAGQFYNIVSRRHEDRSVIITSNLAFKQWGTVFPGSPHSGGSVRGDVPWRRWQLGIECDNEPINRVEDIRGALSVRRCSIRPDPSTAGPAQLAMEPSPGGALTLQHASPLGAATDRRLVYFGPYHFETEADHTLEDDDVRADVERVELSTELSRELVTVVDRCFAVFTDGADELLELARRDLHKRDEKQP